MILPFTTQHRDRLQLWQFWHKQHSKTRLARERSQEHPTHHLFFYCLLFTTIHHKKKDK